MDQGRPLRDVFAELLDDESVRHAYAADPGGLLSAAGHPDLPGELVAEAIVSFAETATPEVAEHLAPFVMANSVVPLDVAPFDAGGEVDPADGLDLLATAPAQVSYDDMPEDLDDLAGAPAPDSVIPLGALDFGTGSDLVHDWAQPAAASEPVDAPLTEDAGIVPIADDLPGSDEVPLVGPGLPESGDESESDSGTEDDGID